MNYSKEINAATNNFIRENYDQLHILVPLGTKTALRGRFAGKMTLNKYINYLIELDLRGKIDWRDFDDDCRVLRELASDAQA